LVFGLVFFAVGIKRPSEQALLAGLRIFLAMGVAALPVLVSGLVSARVLAGASWLNPAAVSRHRVAGIITVVVVAGVAALSGVALSATSRNGRGVRAWAKPAVSLLAIAALAAGLWTAYLGGRLRHSELLGRGADDVVGAASCGPTRAVRGPALPSPTVAAKRCQG
jgi:hypothetical protein